VAQSDVRDGRSFRQAQRPGRLLRWNTCHGAARACAAIALFTTAIAAQDRDARPSPADARDLTKTFVAFADVLPVWGALEPRLPGRLAGQTLEAVRAAWDDWVRTQDAEIRARVARGHEDSLVNWWLFGTSFTSLPPARPRDVERLGGGVTVAQVVDRRLEDLVDGLTSPGANERLRWAGQFLRARGVDPATPRGRAGVRALLEDASKRMLAEDAAYTRVLEAPNAASDPLSWMLPYASLYRERGLSSDTSILSSHAVDSALGALDASGLIGPGTIARVAVVGPGLDFINKADGHDFYPEQSIQPFTVVDSLRRHGLAAHDVSVTTFDVSARVNQHLMSAAERARGREGYVLHLPLGGTERWSRGLVSYWEHAGDRIGEAARALPVPPAGGAVKVRAVRVDPAVVLSIVPADLNIVFERLAPLRDDQLFDLVVATNVFAYYDPFQQALAMRNIGEMLRPGGSLLLNQAVAPLVPMKPAVGHDAVAHSDRQFDHVFWYQRE
jgi:hypothetical protein